VTTTRVFQWGGLVRKRKGVVGGIRESGVKSEVYIWAMSAKKTTFLTQWGRSDVEKKLGRQGPSSKKKKKKHARLEQLEAGLILPGLQPGEQKNPRYRFQRTKIHHLAAENRVQVGRVNDGGGGITGGVEGG